MLLPLKRADKGAGSVDGLAAFEGTVPVPMMYPGEEYGIQKPWFPGEEKSD